MRADADAFLSQRDAAAAAASQPLQDHAAPLRIPPPGLPASRRLAVAAMRLSPSMTEAGWGWMNGGLARLSRRRIATICTGDRLHVDLRDFIGSRLFHFGVWEPNVTAVVLDALRPGDVFCDVGANIGYYTVLASRLVGPTGMVVAVEPSPTALRRLHDNIALNGLTNVRVVAAAVTASRGRIALYTPLSGNAGTASTVSRPGHAEQADVAALPLTDILTPDEMARLRLVKIDIEGGEGPVLANILEERAAFPPGAEFLAELGVDATTPGAAGASELVARFNAAGFHSRAVANNYELSAYLAFKGPEAMQDVRLPMTDQTDVLFSRRPRVAAAA